jgi:hypothetical protein
MGLLYVTAIAANLLVLAVFYLDCRANLRNQRGGE